MMFTAGDKSVFADIARLKWLPDEVDPYGIHPLDMYHFPPWRDCVPGQHYGDGTLAAVDVRWPFIDAIRQILEEEDASTG